MIAADPISLRRPRPQFIVAAAAVIAWGILIVTGPVDWDLGWQMHLADRMLAGQKLYVDVGVTEQHPPLLTWICEAVTAIARLVHLDPIRFYLALTVIASIVASYIAARIARGGALMFVGFGAAAIAVHGIAGGSGEQISTSLALPYLAAAAAYIHGQRFQKRTAIALGLVAGFGMALKPHYALMWFLTEVAVAIHARSWRTLFRAESVSNVSVWVAYIVATVLFTPAYFHAAMQAAAFYGSFMQRSLADVIWSSPWKFMLVTALAIVVMRKRSEHATLTLLLFLAAIAMYIGALVQMKGWYHHWTPAIGLTIATLATLWPPRARWLGIVLVIIGASMWLHAAQKLARRAQQVGPTFLPAMKKLLAARAPRGPLLILDNGLAIGFPLVNFTHASWTLPESCLWMVAGLYADQWSAGKPIIYRTPDKWIPFEKEVHELIWRGVQERPPRLILIPGPVAPERFNFLKFVGTDPRMARFLEGWAATTRVGPYVVYEPPGTPDWEEQARQIERAKAAAADSAAAAADTAGKH